MVGGVLEIAIRSSGARVRAVGQSPSWLGQRGLAIGAQVGPVGWWGRGCLFEVGAVLSDRGSKFAPVC